MARLDGKIAFVSGAGRGIGFATAQRFAEEGAIVTITDLDGEAATRAAREIGGDAEGLQQDVRDPDGWSKIIDDVTGKHGGLDILVNNAGILATQNSQTVENTDMAQWQALQEVNVNGVMLGCQAAIAAMKKSGGGSIVNLSSIAAMIGTPHLFAYGASKGAVRQMTKSVAILFLASDESRYITGAELVIDGGFTAV